MKKTRSVVQEIFNIISSLSSFGIFYLGFYTLFYTNIPASLIMTLNEEISILKQKKIQLSDENADFTKEASELLIKQKWLKETNNQHLRKIKSIIIDAVISDINEFYEMNLNICKQASHLEELYKWKQNHLKFNFPKCYSKFSVHELLKKMSGEKVDRKSPLEYYKDIRKNLDKRKNQTGIDIIQNSIKIDKVKLLSQDEIYKIECFVKSYISKKSDIYKLLAHPTLLSTWTFPQIDQHALTIKANILKMQVDLPVLKLELTRFYDTLLLG